MDANLDNIHMEERERHAQVRSSQGPSLVVVLSLAVVLMILGGGVYVLGFYLK